MGRSKEKTVSNSPAGSRATPNGSKNTKQSTSKRSLYDDDNDDANSDGSKTIVSENESKQGYKEMSSKKKHNHERNATPPLLELNVNRPMKKSRQDEDHVIPDIIESAERNDDAISSIMPHTVSSSHQLQMKGYLVDENDDLPQTTKLMVTSIIRRHIFRRIKFVHNDKLSMEGNILKQLFESTGFRDKKEQTSNFEIIRSLVLRVMNQKRNYCIDQILAKARGMKVVYFSLLVHIST
jgi:hypothetical protein